MVVVYGNEVGVGNVIVKFGILCDELFVIIKLWNFDQGIQFMVDVFDFSFEKLQFESVNFYLIYWFWVDFDCYVDSWIIMEQFKVDGKSDLIGVLNFYVLYFECLVVEIGIVLVVDQFELYFVFVQ